MEIIEFRKWLEKAIKGMRQYRKYDICNLIVSKVFNNGCGCIELFRFYIVEKKIAINKTMFNKRDKAKLDTICETLGISDWERVYCVYDYTDWYNHDFGLKYSIKDDKKAV